MGQNKGFDKSKSIGNGLPNMMFTEGCETFDQSKIANGFNKFFLGIEPKLASFIFSSFKDLKNLQGAAETTLDGYLL